MSILFDEWVFGPVKSRRLGSSLGINLLPGSHKWCNFNCVYCECGWTDSIPDDVDLPDPETVVAQVEKKLSELYQKKQVIDSLTFAGNGEPTLHPYFPEILDEIIRLRNVYFPKAKVSVLSNSTTVDNERVLEAITRADQPIMKLDAGTDKMFQMINQPVSDINVRLIVKQLAKMEGKCIIQTLFFRGEFNGQKIDNSTEGEVDAWLYNLKLIKPSKVMIYSLDRHTPARNISKISYIEMLEIAKKVEDAGFKVQINE